MAAWGRARPVTDADGTQITYSPDAQYQLMNDIPLTAGSIWNLPAGFTGSFTSSDGNAVTKDAPIYDSATDTIYVYNSYQLDLIHSNNAGEEPVMSNDMIAEEFGMGQLVYPDGTPANGDAAAQSYLTYGPDHNYVLAMEFTAERPGAESEAVVYGAGDADGRNYVGQVIYHDEDGTEYILIETNSSSAQSGKTDENGNPVKVTEPVWAQKQYFHILGGYEWSDTDDPPYCVYPGDADQTDEKMLYGDPDADPDECPGVGEATGVLEGLAGTNGAKRERHFGSQLIIDETTGNKTCTYDKSALEYNVNIERAANETTEPVYGSWANYIIFRDIDFNTVNVDGGEDTWKPLMFSGNMEGRKECRPASVPQSVTSLSVLLLQRTVF